MSGQRIVTILPHVVTADGKHSLVYEIRLDNTKLIELTKEELLDLRLVCGFALNDTKALDVQVQQMRIRLHELAVHAETLAMRAAEHAEKSKGP